MRGLSWRDDEGRLRAHALQQSTRPRLRGTIPLLVVLMPNAPREQELWLVQVQHDPGETIEEVSLRLTQYKIIAFVHNFLISFFFAYQELRNS
jgi:hypothetical protein